MREDVLSYLRAVAAEEGFGDDEELRDFAELLSSSPVEATRVLQPRLERGATYLDEHEDDAAALARWITLLRAYELAGYLQAAERAWPLATAQSLRDFPYCGLGARVNGSFLRGWYRDGGRFHTVLVPTVNDWLAQYAHTDCYASVWRFAAPARETKALTSVAKAGDVPFDIDGHERPLAEAHADAQRLVERLLQLGLTPEHLHVSFSGQGFHVLVDVDLPPSPDLPARAKKLATAIAADCGVSIDTKVYADTALLRVLGSTNTKVGRVKVALSLDELAAPLERIVAKSEDAARLPSRSVG